jgi:hypothetical protein
MKKNSFNCLEELKRWLKKGKKIRKEGEIK